MFLLSPLPEHLLGHPTRLSWTPRAELHAAGRRLPSATVGCGHPPAGTRPPGLNFWCCRESTGPDSQPTSNPAEHSKGQQLLSVGHVGDGHWRLLSNAGRNVNLAPGAWAQGRHREQRLQTRRSRFGGPAQQGHPQDLSSRKTSKGQNLTGGGGRRRRTGGEVQRQEGGEAAVWDGPRCRGSGGQQVAGGTEGPHRVCRSVT